MRIPLRPTALAVSALLTGSVVAQGTELRGLPQPGTTRLPSAQQQLDQNLSRQKSDFSVRQQIERSNRLNRTEQINRLNSRPKTERSPCASTDEACQKAR